MKAYFHALMHSWSVCVCERDPIDDDVDIEYTLTSTIPMLSDECGQISDIPRKVVNLSTKIPYCGTRHYAYGLNRHSILLIIELTPLCNVLMKTTPLSIFRISMYEHVYCSQTNTLTHMSTYCALYSTVELIAHFSYGIHCESSPQQTHKQTTND